MTYDYKNSASLLINYETTKDKFVAETSVLRDQYNSAISAVFADMTYYLITNKMATGSKVWLPYEQNLIKHGYDPNTGSDTKRTKKTSFTKPRAEAIKAIKKLQNIKAFKTISSASDVLQYFDKLGCKSFKQICNYLKSDPRKLLPAESDFIASVIRMTEHTTNVKDEEMRSFINVLENAIRQIGDSMVKNGHKAFSYSVTEIVTGQGPVWTGVTTELPATDKKVVKK